ncbi:cell division cycle-associated protein 2 isoform X2 [Phyllobates terribilis]|uniref:cell division cycle-associated protein 2 isoform X2 n=1 Tax=Phyllobates terribilis TaxID=111132 RepID=UPI003CCA78CA
MTYIYEKVMARRNVLQEIPILVPQTEQQSYEIVSEDEAATPHNKPTSFSTERPHSRYISNDEAKENITPTQLEDVYKEKTSQVTVFEGGDVCDDPGPSSSGHSSSGAGAVSSPKRNTEASADDPPPCNPPIDFSTLSVEDLGICSESFTTKSAEKSPRLLHKHRRRSTIGVRGSPEMNFLIRQIALQRSNRKSEPEPPDNPFTSPRSSILREKISAFRSAFQVVEETDKTPSFPGFSKVEELEFQKGKLEGASEPPEKRKKLCDATNQGVSGALQQPPFMSCPSHPLESSQKYIPEMTVEPDCSRLTTEVFSKPEVQIEETQTLPSSPRSHKRKVMFTDLLSPPEPELPLISETSSGPVLKPALKKTPRRDYFHFGVGFIEEDTTLFSLPKISDDEENTDINKSEDLVKIKKRVTFGRQLSPELFDKSLPANTPLRRGSTPYNYCALDATPSAEQSTCQSPCDSMPQPDFDANDEEESLLPLTLCFDAESSNSDSLASSLLPVESSADEETEAAVDTSSSTDDLEISCNEAAEEAEKHPDIVNDSMTSFLDVSFAVNRETRSSTKRKLSGHEEAQESNVSKAKVKATAKKTKKPVIIKAQVKAPRGKGKKGRKSKKSVQKPVYSERDVISKKPLLSPIPEVPESIPSPAPTPWDLPHDKGLCNLLVDEVHKADKVQEIKTQFTFDNSPEINFEEKEPGKTPVHIVEDVVTQDGPAHPTLENMKAFKSEFQRKVQDLPASDVFDLTSQGECPQPPSRVGITDEFSKLATNGLSPSLVKEKSKTKNSKRRSSTRLHKSRALVTSQDADHRSYKPISIDDPVHGTLVLSSDENTSTSSSTPPITSEPKKSRRSSRNHQVSDSLLANPEQNTLEELWTAMPPHSDSDMSDFCLPIDEVLQFPLQEKKVRRSMRLRRGSAVNGLLWVAENREGDMTGRRKSVSSVTRCEESSAFTLEITVHSPNKENLSGYQVLNIAKKNRRRTLDTATIQESVSNRDTRRRRSNCSYKAPHCSSDDEVHSVLVPDA